jgi:hypothetical protein
MMMMMIYSFSISSFIYLFSTVRRTFTKEHMSIENTAETCTEILGLPPDRARDLALYARHQGFGRLGTWARDECTSLGAALQFRDLDCRVVPFAGGLPGAETERDGRKTEVSSATVNVSVLKSLVENSYLLSLER